MSLNETKADIKARAQSQIADIIEKKGISKTNVAQLFQDLADLINLNVVDDVYVLNNIAMSFKRSLEIPVGVTGISNAAFANKDLSSLVLPTTLTTIGFESFRGNKIENLIIPSSVTEIQANAFSYGMLKTLELNEGLTTIGNNCFEYNQISDLIIPQSLTSLGQNAFNANGLSSVNFGNVSNIPFNAFGNNNLGNLVIPDSIDTIGQFAFASSQITVLTFGSTAVNIDENAFSTNAFTEVTLPAGSTYKNNSFDPSVTVTGGTIVP
jgi:hypothetical protein